MKTLVLFGSKSDSSVYEPLCEQLKSLGPVEFRVLSAHRDPDALDVALKEIDYDIVVAGAGLAAHLPGVIASKIAKPVFGIPVKAHLGGLDALLSIQQMPFGVPVLSCGPARELDLPEIIKSYESCSDSQGVNLVINPKILNYEYVDIELKRTKKFLNENKIEFKIVDEAETSCFNIILVNESKEINQDLSIPAIHVPIFDTPIKNAVRSSLTLLEWTEKFGGTWVGINNTRNAVISFMKLYNKL